jgi:hypothetical protein
MNPSVILDKKYWMRYHNHSYHLYARDRHCIRVSEDVFEKIKRRYKFSLKGGKRYISRLLKRGAPWT